MICMSNAILIQFVMREVVTVVLTKMYHFHWKQMCVGTEHMGFRGWTRYAGNHCIHLITIWGQRLKKELEQSSLAGMEIIYNCEGLENHFKKALKDGTISLDIL